MKIDLGDVVCDKSMAAGKTHNGVGVIVETPRPRRGGSFENYYLIEYHDKDAGHDGMGYAVMKPLTAQGYRWVILIELELITKCGTPISPFLADLQAYIDAEMALLR